MPQTPLVMKRYPKLIPIVVVLGLVSYAFLSTSTWSSNGFYPFSRGHYRSTLPCLMCSRVPDGVVGDLHSTESQEPSGASLVNNTTKPELLHGESPVASLVSTKKADVAEKEQADATRKVASDSPRARPLDKFRNGFSISEEYCPDHGLGLKVVIMISSACTNENKRLAIRQTWGHYGMRRDVVILFVLGQPKSTSVQDRLEKEQYIFRDLIQGRFLDSYRNLTLKSIYMLEWLDMYCYNAMFILKTDDDMFINVPRLIAFINQHSSAKRTIFGRLAVKWKPVRSKQSKYYLDPAVYNESYLPNFLTGPAYLFTGDIIPELNDQAQRESLIPLEDVYITGIVAGKLKINRVSDRQFKNTRSKKLNFCEAKSIISMHEVSHGDQFELWKMLSNSVPLKCK